MPLSAKGSEIMSHMKEEYGSEKGEQVFYASKNAGKISGVDCEADCATNDSAAHGLPASYPETSTTTEPLPSAPIEAPHVPTPVPANPTQIPLGMTDSPMEQLPSTIGQDDTFRHSEYRWDVWNCNVPPGQK
jgi:hypothetical protein